MSHPARMSVGIAGITGKFAGLILDNLLKDPTVRVRGYCRNAAKLANRYSQSTQLEILEGDAHDQVALSKFVENLDVVVCAYLGDNDFMVSAQKALVDACDQARVARYIASDYCLDYTSLKLGDLPAKDPMKIIHSYVHGKQHVKGVHVLIGAFMETFWSNYFQIWNTNDKALVYWGTGDETWESTTYGDAAEYTAAIALDPTAVGFKKFLGDKKSLHEIARDMEEAYGFRPKLQCQGTLDDLYTRMQSLRSEKPSEYYSWIAMFYQYYCIDSQTSISGALDNARYPHVKPQTFRDFFATHALADLPNTMADLGKRGQGDP